MVLAGPPLILQETTIDDLPPGKFGAHEDAPEYGFSLGEELVPEMHVL